MTHARVLAGHGANYLLQMPSPHTGERLAKPLGRRQEIVVGDEVRLAQGGDGTAIIESVLPRKNLMRRSDAMRSKAIAANLDQAAYVIGAEPPYSEELLLRVQIAAHVERIDFFVIANKSDLRDAYARIAPRIALLRALGVDVYELTARHGEDAELQPLRDRLAGRTTLLLGQSGMGKSTLLNRLVPQANMRTQEISQALSSGRHTTSFTRLFRLDEECSFLIDSPGFQVFGLNHLSPAEALYQLLEFAPAGQRCRFNDCTHHDEPGCAVRARVDAGQVDAQRYRCYRSILDEIIAGASATPRR